MSKPEINVTPLIDVLLVLLIIFMVVTPIKPSAFKAKVPAEPNRTQPIENDPHTLVVVVEKNASLRINSEYGLGTVNDSQKTTDRLKQIFAARLANYGLSSTGDGSVPTGVFIKAPPEIDYGSVAKVVDAVKMSGAEPIALQIDDLN